MDCSIEFSGIDTRILLRRFGNKEVKRIGMWTIRVGTVKNLTVFRRQYLKTGTKRLINMGLVPARVWEHKS